MNSVILTLMMSAFVEGNNLWAKSKLREVFSWQQLDFQFPNNSVGNTLVMSKRYIQANNSMLGLEVWRNRLFVTVPRWYHGVPSTLNYFHLNNSSRSPLLIPYPDYESNDIHNGNLNDKIISTTRLFADACNRLWVPDNGQEGISLTTPTVLTFHKLFIYDLNTNKLLRKVVIDKSVTKEESLFYDVAVDIRGNDCNKAYAYLADTIGYGIVAYSWQTNTLRRVSNTYFYFEPQSSLFGRVQLNDGIMGLALSPLNSDGFRTLYFHALSSYNEYNVSTQVLMDPQLSSDFTNFHLMGFRGDKSQSTSQRLDEKTGVLFYTQVQRNGIGCWNSKLEYSMTTNGMAAVDRSRVTFPSALTLDSERNIWLLSNSLLSFQSLNPADINYRIFISPVDSLIKDTVCEPLAESQEIKNYWA